MRRNGCTPFTLVLLLGSLVASASAVEPMSTLSAQTQNPIPGQAISLSLVKALDMALSHSASIRAASDRVTAASANLRAAKSPQNPVLSLAHGYGRDTGGLDEDILLTETIQIGAKRKSPVNQASSDLRTNRYEKEGTTADLLLSVKTAYYEALRTEGGLQLAKNALDVARKFREAAKTQFDAGSVARSNVLRAEIEESRAQQEMVSAEMERDNSYASLGSLVGLPGSDLQLTDKLAFTPSDYKLSNLRELAVASRPDILAAKSTVDSFQAALRMAKAQSSPDLFVEGRHSDINPSVGGNSIRFGMTFPIIDLGRKRSEVAAAQAQLAEQQAKLDDTARIAGLEVDTAFNSLQQARKNVESFESGRLQRAAELMDMAQAGYDKGASTYLEVLDAQNVYRSEQADYDRALAAYNTALASLERAVGGHLP